MNKKVLLLILFVFFIPIVSAEIIDMVEQEQKVYGEYQLKVVYIGQNKVKFQLNNMTSDLLEERDLYRFKDRSYIYVREIIENEALEGPDIVSFRLWLAKIPTPIDSEVMQNITEQEIPAIIPKENITEINITEPVEKNITEPEKAVPEEEISLFKRIINWIKNLFKK